MEQIKQNVAKKLSEILEKEYEEIYSSKSALLVNLRFPTFEDAHKPKPR